MSKDKVVSVGQFDCLKPSFAKTLSTLFAMVLSLALAQVFSMPADQLALSPNLPAVPLQANYFVSTSGDDSFDGRTESTAFSSILKAIRVARAGDAVFIRGGNYHENGALRFKTSGEPDKPIIFMSYPGEKAVIEWSGHEGGNEKENVVLDGADYLVFRDLVIKDSPQQCLLLINGADYNTFINMQFLNCWGSGFQIFEGSYNLVAYSRALGNYGGGNADGFGSIGQGGSSDANEFWFNLAANNSDDGFDTWKGTRTLFFGNLAFDNGYNGGDGNGFKLGADSVNNQGLIQHNIAYNNARNGFDTNLGGGNLIENNTAWGNARHNFENTRSVSANLFRNNVSANGSVAMVAEPIEESNSWNLGINDAGFISTDHHNNSFLSLAQNSPLVDRGVVGSLPFKGSAPDLGALELGLSLNIVDDRTE